MPYRVNGQYIMEGLASSFLFTLGGLGFIILDRTHSPTTPKLNRILLISVGFLCIIISFLACWVFMRMKLPWVFYFRLKINWSRNSILFHIFQCTYLNILKFLNLPSNLMKQLNICGSVCPEHFDDHAELRNYWPRCRCWWFSAEWQWRCPCWSHFNPYGLSLKKPKECRVAKNANGPYVSGR